MLLGAIWRVQRTECCLLQDALPSHLCLKRFEAVLIKACDVSFTWLLMNGNRWLMVVPVSMMSSTSKQCLPSRVAMSIPLTFKKAQQASR